MIKIIKCILANFSGLFSEFKNQLIVYFNLTIVLILIRCSFIFAILPSAHFAEDVMAMWDFENSVEQYHAYGGTSKSSVLRQIQKLGKRRSEMKSEQP